MRTIIQLTMWISVWSSVWASATEPESKFRPVGRWLYHAETYSTAMTYSATIDFAERGTCLVTYMRGDYFEFRQCGWEASGNAVTVYPLETETWEPISLIPANDGALEFASDRRVAFHRRLSWGRD